jgi:hypothetical protein
VPDLQIGMTLCTYTMELKQGLVSRAHGIRSDRNHINCSGAAVTGVEKRGKEISIEIQ